MIEKGTPKQVTGMPKEGQNGPLRDQNGPKMEPKYQQKIRFLGITKHPYFRLLKKRAIWDHFGPQNVATKA